MSKFHVVSNVTNLTVTCEGDKVIEIRLGDRSGGKPDTPQEIEIAKQLGEYLEGKRRRFTFEISPTGTSFQTLVWDALRRIPYGETTTYGKIAGRIGKPGAARAVGMANNKNPIPIVIPCHRVVGSNGNLGGFGAGVQLKKRLLDLETRATWGEQ